jgi:hypothetical protein
MLKFWHVAFAFALPTGVYGSWGSVLDVNLKPFGISQVIYNNGNTICNNNYFVSMRPKIKSHIRTVLNVL